MINKKEKLNMDEEGRSSRKRKKKSQGPYILGMLGCITVLILVVFLGTGLYVWLNEGLKENTDAAAEAAGIVDITYTQEELDSRLAAAVAEARAAGAAEEAGRILGGLEAGLSEGQTMVETLRPFYPEDLVIVSGGRFHFVPIREELAKHGRVAENLRILESGEYQYVENEQVVSHKGIDVSYHQGEIDWARVAQTDVEYAFIRVGYRGYGNGRMVLDEQFENNIKGALGAGLKVGVYFFSQAVNQEEALEEADFVLEQIAPYRVDYPVVFDVERVADAGGRMNQLSMEERTQVTKVFCQRIREAGYTPMIYHNMEMGGLLLDLGQLTEYEKWFAYYGGDLYYPYDYQIWQYSEKGSVDGIGGAVDLNISFKVWGD